MKATRFGKPLPEGGTIGVFAPSGPYENRSDVLRPIEWWQSRGYDVRLTDSVWARHDYVAGPAQGRVDDLHALLLDDDVDVILCLWGGTGAIEMLPLIDYDLVADKPKAIMGFSDITNLHAAMLKHSGLSTFHGPGFGSFGAPTAPPSPGTRPCMRSPRGASATSPGVRTTTTSGRSRQGVRADRWSAATSGR